MAFTEHARIRLSLGCLEIGLLLLLALTLRASSPCFAVEGGEGGYWPGFRANYRAGIIPSKPGWYLRNDILIYTSSAPRVVLNGLPIQGASADVVVDILEPSYVFPRKLWGATHAAVVTQAFVWAKLSDAIQGTDIHLSGRRAAPGDIIVSPLFLGWDYPRLHYNTNLAIFIPTGDYDIRRVVNASRNYWTFDAEFGITYLEPETGWDISGVLGYGINTKNAASHYRSGDVIHLDYAVGKYIGNRLTPHGYRSRPTAGEARYSVRSSPASLASARTWSGKQAERRA